MTNREQIWVDKILAGEHRAVARAISVIENGEPAGIELLKALFPKAGKAYVVGITGSPGAGKSTLVEKLAGRYRSLGEKVGIVAVDPTSPFSGGAILGDRIRMQSLAEDRGVYIRSMATRGHLGGLAQAAHDVVTVFDAAGCEVVLIETVGVGQDEVEVARHAAATVLLLAPGMGDDVQALKAGVMEIADLYVINKADIPGAERVEQQVTSVLSLSSRQDGWQPPVLRTVATTGDGVDRLQEALEEFRSYSARQSIQTERQRQQCQARLLELFRQRLAEMALTQIPEDALASSVNELMERRRDPHSVVDELILKFRKAANRT